MWTLLEFFLFFNKVHLIPLIFRIHFVLLFLLVTLMNSIKMNIFVNLKFGLLVFHSFI